MKKSIDIINADTSLLQWLNNEVDKAPDSINSINDFKLGINNLIDGVSESLLIEKNDSPNKENIFSNIISCKELKIYVNARRVTRNNEDIILTPKEFDILYFLIRNRGIVFTKEQIYKAVWNDNYLLDDSNIMAFIRKLRKKIEPNPDAPIYILTIWGIGYKFNDKL